ncbi:MAG TPA: hypothetical protein VFW35_06670 [Sphingomicrobium sp.]|nr:hypothetical protein [Sphingomicrobium sp.]
MEVSNGVIVYRAHRLRFVIAALLIVPFTFPIAWLGYNGIFLHDSDVRGAWLTPLLGGLYLWFDYMLLAKLIWPPELQVSLNGIRWSNYAMLQWPATYVWQDIEGPTQTNGAQGVPLLQIEVKATGRKLRLPPSHFGATYDEMAAVISAAHAGKLISPDEWRCEHPPHRLRHWLLDWGLPLGLAVGVAFALGWIKI